MTDGLAPAPRDAALKWTTIAALAVGMVAGLVRLPLTIPLDEAAGFAALAGLPASLAFASRRRGWRRMELFFVVALQAILFTLLYTAVAAIAFAAGRPLIDQSLIQLDEWFSLPHPGIRHWAERNGAAADLLWLAYHTILLQMVLTAMFLAWRAERRTLEVLLLRLMIAALITLALFGLYPSLGPLATYDYPPSAASMGYADYLQALRSGERRSVRFFVIEGLICFPSFHTTWAVFLALAFVRHPKLLAIAAPLNLLVIISTMTAGWHYWSDVLGGLAVAAAAYALVAAVSPWVYGKG